LGLHLVVFSVPSRLSTKKALRRLRESDPSGTYDYNHIYLGSGSIDTGGAPPAAAVENRLASAFATPELRVGLIDTGIDAGHPVFAAAAIQHWGCDDKLIPAAHGTAVASLLIGRADAFHGVQPGATLYAADVYCGSASGGAVDALLAAFDWLVRERVPVINVS
jgi:subtilisin family serine protease